MQLQNRLCNLVAEPLHESASRAEERIKAPDGGSCRIFPGQQSGCRAALDLFDFPTILFHETGYSSPVPTILG